MDNLEDNTVYFEDRPDTHLGYISTTGDSELVQRFYVEATGDSLDQDYLDEIGEELSHL